MTITSIKRCRSKSLGITFALLLGVLAGCATTARETAPAATKKTIESELDRAVETASKPVTSEAVKNALLPPLKIELPRGSAKPSDPRFDLTVNNAPAREVFLSIVTGTRYSMLVHPDVSGAISVNLRDVTVPEALEAIRDLYGYDYKIDGNRIVIQPRTIQTRVFQINYITGQRKGNSDVRVSSGSVSDSRTTDNNNGQAATTTINNGGSTARTIDSTRIMTSSNSDFWAEIEAALRAIVGSEAGRQVIVSPQSGVIVVRGMPDELRGVAQYLEASQLAVERQVILEAKILEVELRDGYEQGINWAAFRSGNNHRLSAGPVGPDTLLRPNGVISNSATNARGFDSAPGSDIVNLGTGLFGLAFQTSNFAALLSFLETQGTVHVLSSPRIATINNQKAVLKVGTDEYFVTGITNNTTASTGATTTSPTVLLQPFFSGIALDVTPQIDAQNNIILHIHPSVSQVSTVNKVVSLGQNQNFNLPLASSTVSETDSIVRTRDGQIIAIGGLMRMSSTDDARQVPVAGDVPVVGNLFRHQNRGNSKKELVILLKSTVVSSPDSWARDLRESSQRIKEMGEVRRRYNSVSQSE